MLDLDCLVIKFLFKSQNSLKIGALKKSLKIPHSTLGSCIKRLEQRNFVNYEPYHEVNLTKNGIELAKELNRHSRLLEVLLHKGLGLDPSKAHDESEKFSLLFSCETINKICEKYNHPEECPCGEKILNSSACFCEKEI
ncbi:MAG: metal-dependent transcriptional regulator [Candidatus Hodarchaeota archaeon]